jgi:UDP-GlcNAc:undecaprenyl-phosphate GlcNAc-1-phosphate transferase
MFAACLALLSAAVVRLMIRVGALDHPGARSSHTQPTPKGGGVGIMVAFVVGLLALYGMAGRARVPDVPFLGLIAASVLIAAVSWYDDLKDWPFSVKLGAQCAAALVAIACGIRLHVVHLPLLGAVDTGWLGVPLTAAWIVFATNAVNFIDGLNGLASGSVGIACVFLGAIALGQDDWFVVAASLTLAAGIAGFLPYNFPRARIFMGDVGSQSCGFVVASLGVLAAGYGAQTLSVLLVPILLAGILFDVVFTLARRFLAGQRVTEAHRGHLYQVVTRAGLPAETVALIYWGMAAWGGLCILAFAGHPAAWAGLMTCVILPQLAWLAFVALRARQSAVTEW